MKKTFSLVIALVLLCSFLAGCAGTTDVETASNAPVTEAASEPVAESEAIETSAQTDAETTAEIAEGSEAAQLPEDAYVLPLAETKTLTYWHDVGNDVLNALEDADYDNDPAMQYAQKVTNVHIENRVSSPTEQAADYYLMIASGDLTDLLYSGASLYSGGGSAAVNDGVVLDLAPYVEEGYTPNYQEAFNITPEQAANVHTDEGFITTFLTIYENGPDPAGGLWIRKDWLDKLGMAVPETYDELHDALAAFKSEFGAKEPYYTYIFGDSHLTDGYGVATEIVSNESYDSDTFFQKDGVVHYSALENEWKEVVSMMQEWYAEGLFGTDLANHSINASDSGFIQSVSTGDCGVFRCGTRMIDMVTGSGADNDPDFEVVAMADVTVNADDAYHYTWPTRGYATSGICVSASCSDIPLALAWCDYWYSPEGTIIAQYGEEGVTYNMVDGKPVWTELVTNNPDGLPVVTAMSLYQMTYAACIKSVTTDTTGWAQKNIDALSIWSEKWDGAYAMPDTLSLTAEEASEFSQYYSEISTYGAEMIARFICGEESMDSYAEFCDTLVSMGIDHCIDVEQTALDRYNERLS